MSNTKNRKQRYYIKSKFRFTIFILVCILAATGFINSFIGSRVSGYSQPTYTTVEVASGDTLWDLASTYKADKTDIRKAVYEIKNINNLKSSELTVGSEIYIPTDL